MIKRIQNFWLPEDADYWSAYERDKARLFITIILTTAVVTLCYSPIYFSYDLKKLTALTIFGATGFISSLLLLKHTGQMTSSSVVALVTGTIVVFTSALFSGGFSSSSIWWFTTIPLAAGILISPKAGVFSFIFSLGAVISLAAWQELGGQVFPINSRLINFYLSVINITAIMFVHTFFIFHFRQTRERMQKALDEELEENTTLLRIICHDMSNAVELSLFCAETAIEEGPRPQDQMLWDKVKLAADTQSNILDHVRRFEQAESLKGVVLKPIDFVEIVKRGAGVFWQKLEKKNLTLVYDFDITTEFRVLAEENTLSNIVFNNLLSNAIKFSLPNGNIRISISEDEYCTNISVCDDGIGMSPEYLKTLFSDRNRSREGTTGEKGMGFGMRLVKKYLHLYGANIKVESSCQQTEDQKTHGTTITLTFPKAIQGELPMRKSAA